MTELGEKQVDNAITLFVGEGMHKGYTDEVHECFIDFHSTSVPRILAK